MLCSGHQATATTKNMYNKQKKKEKRKTTEKRRKSQEKKPLLVNKQQQKNKKKTNSKQKGYSTTGTDRVSLKFTLSVPMVEFTKVY